MYGKWSVQTSIASYRYTLNGVTLVWGSLRFAPIKVAAKPNWETFTFWRRVATSPDLSRCLIGGIYYLYSTTHISLVTAVLSIAAGKTTYIVVSSLLRCCTQQIAPHIRTMMIISTPMDTSITKSIRSGISSETETIVVNNIIMHVYTTLNYTLCKDFISVMAQICVLCTNCTTMMYNHTEYSWPSQFSINTCTYILRV